MRSLLVCVFVLLGALGHAHSVLNGPFESRQASTSSAPIFRITTDEFWLNLHHFLYVLGAPRPGRTIRRVTPLRVHHPKPSEA